VSDANALLKEYRDTVRDLWNNHFSERVDELERCGALDDFEEIDRHLFNGIVLASLGDVYWKSKISSFRQSAISFLRVAVVGVSDGEPEVLVAKPEPSRHWVTRVDVQDWSPLVAEFVEIFDWGMYREKVEYPYCVAKIVKFPGHDELIGWLCLLKIDDAQISVVSLDGPI